MATALGSASSAQTRQAGTDHQYVGVDNFHKGFSFDPKWIRFALGRPLLAGCSRQTACGRVEMLQKTTAPVNPSRIGEAPSGDFGRLPDSGSQASRPGVPESYS
jgi:hypothetical protein